MTQHAYGFYLSQWQKDKTTILSLRSEVLFGELDFQISSLEQPFDSESCHIIAYNGDSKPIGTGCITADGKIEQLVVLSQWRRRTIGKAIIKYLQHVAKQTGLHNLFVDAQEDILGFYLSAGFEKTDLSFTRNGILHWKMVFQIKNPKIIVH